LIHNKSHFSLSTTLFVCCLFAVGCNLGGGNNSKTPSNSNKTSASNSSSPTAGAQPLPNVLTGSNSYLQTAQSVREKIGQRYTYTCPAGVKLSESVYSNGDAYYTGSSICSSAIHAGAITQAQGGQVTIEIKPAVSTSYSASDARNGVTPRSMLFNDQKDNGSFVFIKP
jgi:LCCL domain